MDEVIEIQTPDLENIESGTDDEGAPCTSHSVKLRIYSHDSGIDISAGPVSDVRHCDTNTGTASSNTNVLYPTEPNMAHVRHELGTRDGSGIYLDNKAVWENTGLIPKYYKPYSLIETEQHCKGTPPVPLYKCHFCKMIYKGHNSIVYHCRRHVGDYPYKCAECNFVEVCKSGLSSHMRRSQHRKSIKIDGPDRVTPKKTTTPVSRVSKMPEMGEFASNVIKNRSDINKMREKAAKPQVSQDEPVPAHPTAEDSCVGGAPSKSGKTNNPTPVNKMWGLHTEYTTADISQFQPISSSSLVPPVPDNHRYKVYEPNTGLIPTFSKPFKIMRVTENKVVYRCDLCGSNYTSWEDIVHHVRRHYGDYPYRCITCGFAGVSKGSLELHMFDEDHPKSIFLKHRGNHEFFVKPKAKPETGTEVRAQRFVPQIRPSFMQPNAFKNELQVQDDPAIRVQFARIQAALKEASGLLSQPDGHPLPQVPQLGAEFDKKASALHPYPPLSDMHSFLTQQLGQSQPRTSPSPKLLLPRQSRQLLHPAKKNKKVASPKPTQTITTAVTPSRIEEPAACSTPVKKEPLKLTPPKTPEPCKTKLVIVPQKGMKRKVETDLPVPDLTIKKLKEKPDYEYLIWLSERNVARNLLTHSWEFCDECKSAFYNIELYKSHFASSPECRAPK